MNYSSLTKNFKVLIYLYHSNREAFNQLSATMKDCSSKIDELITLSTKNFQDNLQIIDNQLSLITDKSKYFINKCSLDT